VQLGFSKEVPLLGGGRGGFFSCSCLLHSAQSGCRWGCRVHGLLLGSRVMKTRIDAAEGLIFDCDGTLADTMPLHWDAWHETFAEVGLSLPPNFLHQFCGVPSRVIVETYNAQFGTTFDPVRFSLEKQSRVRTKLEHSSRIHVIADVVDANLGRLPMAVASGGTRFNVDLILNAIGLGHAFDTIVTADDDVAAKPAPGIFLETARRLGVAAERCLVFEDGDPGILAAQRAGMPFVDVREVLAS
jgi:HAD superfamily hydrolase (TIGR01509 family)